ncbi:MAG: VTT domain-containing protein [Deltaproteobacteria bacterium]|nr:VTT domain-containing protein [Deltaproteobacteria bacterium]
MKKIFVIVFLVGSIGGIIAGLLYLFIHWPQHWAFMNGMAFQGNIGRLKTFILSFGFWAPLISAFLMISQSVILFLPAFPIFVVNALAFGPVWGTLLSWSSAVLGSVVCFGIAKALGRPVVQHLVSKVHLEAADATLKRYEKYIILLFGFLPVISFDVISYAAGLTVLAYWEFIPLVCIAQVPSALFYSLLVNKIDRGTLDAYWIIAASLFFMVGIGSLGFRALLGRRRRREIPHTPF